MHESKRLTVVQTDIASVDFTMNADEVSILRRLLGGIDPKHGLIGATEAEVATILRIHNSLASIDDEIKRTAMRPFVTTKYAKDG